ncbi:MAG TPA: hypothetical protein VGQ57_04840, partial [Polyangiaceae bacterium]|nr:hypothetical protein [Polyangiaceae bacterium]
MTAVAPETAIDPIDESHDRLTAEPPTLPLSPATPGGKVRSRAVSQARLAELVQGRKAVLCVDNVSVSFD